MLEDRLREATGGYRQAFLDVDEQLLRLYPEKLGLTKPDFRALGADLGVGSGLREIRQARADFQSGIVAVSRDFETRMAGLVELSEVLGRIGVLNEKLRQSSDRQGAQLQGVRGGFARVAECQSVDVMRAALGRQIESLEKAIEAVRQENLALMTEMDSEMSRYRKQLDEARSQAGEDPVTGLPNLRRLEADVKAFLDSGVRFSLILLSIVQLSSVNRQYGSFVGDELLKQFGGRLRAQRQGDEKTARWRGSEFALLVQGGLRDAIARSRPLERALSGDYDLEAGERGRVHVRVAVRFGIAESRAADTQEQLFVRAESLLRGPG